MKTCSKCKIEKSFDNFYKNKLGKNGFSSRCKECFKKIVKEYKVKNKQEVSKYSKKYYQENKNYFKHYFKKNKEKLIEYNRKYFQENKLYRNECFNKRRKTDPLFKLRVSIRTNISNSFKRGNNQFRKGSKTENILGCTIQEFTEYLKSKFSEGMTLENYGEWHLDHIFPVSLAKTEEEIIKLNHYTNFQPLWAEENIRKGNRLDY